METYVVRGEEHRVICGVHNRIRYLVLNSDMDDNTKKHIFELVDVANEMARNMENSLERNRDFGIGMFDYYMGNDDE